MSFKESAIKFFKNKTVVCCLILTAIYLLSGYCKWIEIGLPIFAFVSFVFLPVQSSFCVFLFLHCFTLSNIGYESTFVATIICFAVVLLIKYLFGIKKAKYKLYKALAISIFCFVAISCVISLFNGFYVGGLGYIFYFPIFYCVFAMRGEFNIREAMWFLTFGLVLSVVLSLCVLVLPKYQYYCFQDARFTAFTNHPNSLFIRALFVLCYYLYLFLNGQIKWWQFGLIYLFCAASTLFTKSKMGLGLLALITIAFVALFVKQDFKKRFKFLILFIALVGILCLASYKLIAQIFERFFADSGSVWVALTTGRTDIWADYLKKCVDNPFCLLFGHGMFGEQVFVHAQAIRRDAHNLYIFLLYRFGIVGIVALGFIVYLFLKELNKTAPKFNAYLPLILFLLISLTANTNKTYNIMFLVLSCMIMFSNCKVKTKNGDNPIA